MRNFWKWAAAGLLTLALPGCSSLLAVQEKAQDGARQLAVPAIIGECKLSAVERRGRLDRLNADLAAKGSTARVTPLDCDGDGDPDAI